jgi:hypothetical protein
MLKDLQKEKELNFLKYIKTQIIEDNSIKHIIENDIEIDGKSDDFILNFINPLDNQEYLKIIDKYNDLNIDFIKVTVKKRMYRFLYNIDIINTFIDYTENDY